MIRQITLCAATCLATSLALAQPMASVTVTANGGAAAVVQPGEPVTIRANFWQNGWCIGRAEGGTLVTDNAGNASNFSSWLPALPTINFGAFQGGSRLGTDFAFTPPGFLGASTPPQGMSHFNLFTYTLVLDEPGEYMVDWQASSTTPDILIYTSIGSFSWIPAQSTYIGATITVVPAPASLALLAFGAIAAPRRRR